MAARKHSHQPVPAHKQAHKEARSTGEKEPELMVQLPDPKMIRKEVLESLREVIIFMQGYEKFRALQDEKVGLFLKLKTDVKEITTLLDTKLRAHFPKGKLRLPTPVAAPVSVQTPVEPKIVTQSPGPRPASSQTNRVQRDELTELEDQLKDIEGQLQGLN
ncbi:hypothetical protein HYV86_06120 [Candidatus Woesearchaeota archaeon]|nr:hypothetical protein [Candidatus Woesearchaeota archaeon]